MLKTLRVLHIHTHDLPLAGPLPEAILGGFYLETCQRRLWVCTEGQLEQQVSGMPSSVSLLSGVPAYSFLVRVAAGLESQVIGETDVFGQLKKAWQKQNARLSKELQVIFPNIFQDAKEIRSTYLEHLGGLTYGTLVRKYLAVREANSKTGITLLVGAGQLASSVAPFLTGSEIWISNRSVDKAQVLADELIQKGFKVQVLKSEAQELAAFEQAQKVVLCVPVDEKLDAQRAAAWSKNQGTERVALHLGTERVRSGAWETTTKIEFLNDIFEFQKAQGEVRSLKIAQALKACEERAKLRSLGSSMGIHHGWEDLAVFG